MRGHDAATKCFMMNSRYLRFVTSCSLLRCWNQHHRAPHAVFIDEGQDVLQVLAMVQVEELGGALGVVARQRMGGDVVDLRRCRPRRRGRR